MIETYKVFDWLAHSDDTRLATFKKQTLFWELIKCIRTSFKYPRAWCRFALFLVSNPNQIRISEAILSTATFRIVCCQRFLVLLMFVSRFSSENDEIP